MNSSKSPIAVILGAVVIALLSAVGGYALWNVTNAEKTAETEALLLLPEPRVIADFALVDKQGDEFALQDLQDRWSLLFFGFTHCPDVCPSALFDLQQLTQMLEQQEQPLAPHQVVFVSVDPERDSPEQLKQYTDYFSPEFRAVTGDHRQLAPLTRQMGIAYRVDEHEAGASAYQVDHSASILLTNPDGRLHGVFPAPQDVETMFRDLVKTLN